MDVSDQIPSVGQSRNTSDETELDSLTTDRATSHYTTVYRGISPIGFCVVLQKITEYKGFIMASMSGHF